MNFGEMQTMTRMQAGDTDTTDPYFEDAEVRLAINQACIHLAKKTRSLQTYKTGNMAQGTGEYGLPKDFLQVKDVRLIVASTGEVKTLGDALSHDEFQERLGSNPNQQGEPYCYNLEFGATAITPNPPPGTINFYYLPNAAYVASTSGFQYKIWYWQIPTELVEDEDTTELHQALHMTVCYYAALLLTRKIGDLEKQASLSQLYAESVQEDEEFIHKMNRTSGRHVKSAYGPRRRRRSYLTHPFTRK